MKKLIDWLNELAVAEAETEALGQEIEKVGAGSRKAEALEDKWDEAYRAEVKIFKETAKYIMKFGIDCHTACVMLRTKRTELVKIAEKE